MCVYQKIFKPLTTVVLFWFESPPIHLPPPWFLRFPSPPLPAFPVTLHSGGYRCFLEPYNNCTIIIIIIIIGGREIFQKSIITLTTSNNQRLGSAFDDLDPRLSLLYQVGDDVIHPCKICGMPDTHPKIHSLIDRLSHTSRLQSILGACSFYVKRNNKCCQ